MMKEIREGAVCIVEAQELEVFYLVLPQLSWGFC
jgi:hypothetical protein